MRVLMRMVMSPFDNCSLYDVVLNDRIGSNSGNLLFPYSIIRNIYSDGMAIDGYVYANPEDADKINSNYDMYIIPLANAFRNNFRGELRNLTNLIKKLTIPCVVVGVGMQTDYEPDLTKKNSFDEDVVDFCKAVLEKSNSIGVRGEITASYLRKLGFGQHVQVIGCPSMFMYGDFLPLKESMSLSKETKVAINYHAVGENFFDFLQRVKADFPDYCYILQKIYELRLLYAGDMVQDEFIVNKNYVGTADNRIFMENRMRMFINVPSWINFLSKLDVSVGSCIHGSIASVLSGNPTLVFAADSRVRELAEYHKIPVRKITDVNDTTSFQALYEKTDFSMVRKGHRERYRNFQNFLKNNGISYTEISDGEVTDFDKKMETIPLNNPEGVSCYTSLPIEEQKVQLERYLAVCNGKIHWCRKAVEEGKVEFKELLSQWQKSKSCTMINLKKLYAAYTGMVKSDCGWWYMKDGKLDTGYTGMAKNQYGWWYMKNGKLDTTYTGMAKNDYGWWYMKDGELDVAYTGIASNDYGQWYMKNGKLDTTYTGIVKYNGINYQIKNGKVVG